MIWLFVGSAIDESLRIDDLLGLLTICDVSMDDGLWMRVAFIDTSFEKRIIRPVNSHKNVW